MNTAKTAETLKGLLDLETGDSLTIVSSGERIPSSKENERYDIIVHIIRADAQTKEPAAEDREKAAGKKHPAGIIIP